MGGHDLDFQQKIHQLITFSTPFKADFMRILVICNHHLIIITVFEYFVSSFGAAQKSIFPLPRLTFFELKSKVYFSAYLISLTFISPKIRIGNCYIRIAHFFDGLIKIG